MVIKTDKDIEPLVRVPLSVVRGNSYVWGESPKLLAGGFMLPCGAKTDKGQSMDNQTTSVAKKPFYKRWWFIVIAAIFVFAIIGSMGKGNKQAAQPTSQGEQTTANTQPAPAASQKQYIEAFKFTGNGAKKSEPFTITGDRFKIAYDCKGDSNATLCQAFAYKVGSNLPSAAIMNSASAIKDETILYGKGEYYIDANTIGNYTMIVYDYR